MKQLSQQLYELGVSAGIDLTDVTCPFKLKEMFEACKEEYPLKMSHSEHQHSPPLKKPKATGPLEAYRLLAVAAYHKRALEEAQKRQAKASPRISSRRTKGLTRAQSKAQQQSQIEALLEQGERDNDLGLGIGIKPREATCYTSGTQTSSTAWTPLPIPLASDDS